MKNIIFCFFFILTTINFSKANPTEGENVKEKRKQATKDKILSVASPEANKENQNINTSNANKKTQNENKTIKPAQYKFVTNLLLERSLSDEDKVKLRLGCSFSYDEELWLNIGLKLNLDVFYVRGSLLLNEKTPALVFEVGPKWKAFYSTVGFLLFISKYGIFAGFKLEQSITEFFCVEFLFGSKFYHRSAYETYYE